MEACCPSVCVCVSICVCVSLDLLGSLKEPKTPFTPTHFTFHVHRFAERQREGKGFSSWGDTAIRCARHAGRGPRRHECAFWQEWYQKHSSLFRFSSPPLSPSRSACHVLPSCSYLVFQQLIKPCVNKIQACLCVCVC